MYHVGSRARGLSSGVVQIRCSMARGVLVPQLGVEPMSLALQGEFSTSKPPGKSPSRFFFFYFLPKAPPTDCDTHPGTVVVKRKIVSFPFPLLCPWGRKPSRGAVSQALFLLDCPSGTALVHLFLLALYFLALGIAYQSPFCFYYLCEAETCSCVGLF